MKQSSRHLKLAKNTSQKGIIALWSDLKWSQHCTGLVCVLYLNTPLVFILYVLSRQSSDKAEFPFPRKHLTLPRPTALSQWTEISLHLLPFSWPFPTPTASPTHSATSKQSCPPVPPELQCWWLQNTTLCLGNSQLYFELWKPWP